MKYTDLHYGQIPTLYQALKSELSKSGTAAIISLLRCFAYSSIVSNEMTTDAITVIIHPK